MSTVGISSLCVRSQKQRAKANSLTLAYPKGCARPATLSDDSSQRFQESGLRQTLAWMEVHADALAKLHPRSDLNSRFQVPPIEALVMKSKRFVGQAACGG